MLRCARQSTPTFARFPPRVPARNRLTQFMLEPKDSQRDSGAGGGEQSESQIGHNQEGTTRVLRSCRRLTTMQLLRLDGIPAF
ncbi:hypothetical protein KSP39_PZI009492 [Platanthera zijinensis]|uniref:Uncharacterized protein n=1 Tax=Platanthera zijinensis TaxID=2320716 RepID=A0AAP0BKX2_9ASPA